MTEKWIDAISICLDHGMKFASLDSLAEHDYFLARVNDNSTLLTDLSIHIGGYTKVPKSKDDWIWQNSGNAVAYKMNFLDGEPEHRDNGEPDHRDNNERCLSILRLESKLALHDGDCGKELRFICQREFDQVKSEEVTDQPDGSPKPVTEPTLVEGGETELSPPTPKPKDPEDELKVSGFSRIVNYGKLAKLIVQILQS